MAPTLLFIYLAKLLNRDGHESANKILARIYPKTGQSLPQNLGIIKVVRLFNGWWVKRFLLCDHNQKAPQFWCGSHPNYGYG